MLQDDPLDPSAPQVGDYLFPPPTPRHVRLVKSANFLAGMQLHVPFKRTLRADDHRQPLGMTSSSLYLLPSESPSPSMASQAHQLLEEIAKMKEATKEEPSSALDMPGVRAEQDFKSGLHQIDTTNDFGMSKPTIRSYEARQTMPPRRSQSAPMISTKSSSTNDLFENETKVDQDRDQDFVEVDTRHDEADPNDPLLVSFVMMQPPSKRRTSGMWFRGANLDVRTFRQIATVDSPRAGQSEASSDSNPLERAQRKAFRHQHAIDEEEGIDVTESSSGKPGSTGASISQPHQASVEAPIIGIAEDERSLDVGGYSNELDHMRSMSSSLTYSRALNATGLSTHRASVTSEAWEQATYHSNRLISCIGGRIILAKTSPLESKHGHHIGCEDTSLEISPLLFNENIHQISQPNAATIATEAQSISEKEHNNRYYFLSRVTSLLLRGNRPALASERATRIPVCTLPNRFNKRTMAEGHWSCSFSRDFSVEDANMPPPRHALSSYDGACDYLDEKRTASQSPQRGQADVNKALPPSPMAVQKKFSLDTKPRRALNIAAPSLISSAEISDSSCHSSRSSKAAFQHVARDLLLNDLQDLPTLCASEETRSEESGEVAASTVQPHQEYASSSWPWNIANSHCSSVHRLALAARRSFNRKSDEGNHGLDRDPAKVGPRPKTPKTPKTPQHVPHAMSENNIQYLTKQPKPADYYIPPYLVNRKSKEVIQSRASRSPRRGRDSKPKESPRKSLADVDEESEDVLEYPRSARERSRSPHKRLFGENGWLTKSHSTREISQQMHEGDEGDQEEESPRRGGLKQWGDKMKRRIGDLVSRSKWKY